MKSSTIFRKALLPVFCFCALASCTRDNSHDGPGLDMETGEETIQLSIDIPGAKDAAQSRALADDDAECVISSIDVLQFTTGGKFAYRAPGFNISGGGASRTFKANLLVGDYTLVLIANARDQVNNADAGTGGVTKWDGNTDIQGALDKLSVTVGKSDKITSGGVLSTLPMFGIAEDVAVQKGLSLTEENAIQMVRMVSKIEVRLTTEAASGTDGGTGNGNFRLLDARLYNQALTGGVAPEISSWPATNIAAAPYYGGTLTPSKASYPTDAPLVYSGTADKVTNNDILHSIYTFEAPAGSDARRDDNVCLVVGGCYNGSSQPSYYRVDFRQLDNATTRYLPLLRNHRYSVNVRSVTGPGYSDPDDAFYGETSQMEVDILYWNDGGLSDIIFDGRHFLALSQGSFEFTREARTSEDTDNKLTVRTDVPAGWTAKVWNDLAGETDIANDGTTGNPWLRISPASGNGADTPPNEMLLEMDTNNSGAERTAYIHITAGRLNYIVKVVQSATAALGIRLTDKNGKPITELVFVNKATIPSQILNVNWQPKDAPLTIVKTAIGTYGEPTGANIPDTDITDGTGFQQYNVTPTAFSAAEIAADPFLEKMSRVDFSTTNGISTTYSTLYLRQMNYTVVPVGIPDCCLLNGDSYSFGVRSNTAWKIESVKEIPNDASSSLLNHRHDDDNLKVGTIGGYDISESGEEIRFTVVDEDTLSGTIEVTFISPTGLFDPVTVTIEMLSVWGRSNIVWIPDDRLSSGGIFTFAVTRDDHTSSDRTIPVEDNETEYDVPVRAIPANVQGVFFKWGSLVAISPPTLESQSHGTRTYVANQYPDGHILYSPVTLNSYAWDDIPRANEESSPFDNSDKAEDDFATYNNSKGYDASAGKGDICRYISAMGWVEGNWRLPTQDEYDKLIVKPSASNGDFTTAINVAPNDHPDNAYGFYQPLSGWWLGRTNNSSSLNNSAIAPVSGVYFPSSGNRHIDGTANNASSTGVFWSGSSNGKTNVHSMYVVPNATGDYSANRQVSFPVRCIRQ